MKELTLQMEVDALVCHVVDGTCSRSEYADARCYSEFIDIDEVGDGVQLLSVWWLESEWKEHGAYCGLCTPWGYGLTRFRMLIG